jgi:hypothetical protein
MRRALKALDRVRTGEVSPWAYAILRVSLAVLHLVRSSDLARPVVELEHHRWVRGLDFSWSVTRAPELASPALHGFALGPIANDILVYARTFLCVSLLLGVRPRLSAAAVAIVSYALLLADRYRYFHHLHLLYVALGLLAFCPLGDRLSLERQARLVWRRFRPGAVQDLPPPASSPAWSLAVLRALVSGVYLSAGLAKLEPEYWSGQTLAELDRIGMLGGPAWEVLRNAFGYAWLARFTCLIELALPLLLAWKRTRWLGVALAVTFHLVLGSVLAVSTFGVTMVLLLLSYWPKSRPQERSPERASAAYNGRAG